MRRRLIVTADDFGMAPEVNEAVEAAHRDGVLTGASLLITGAAAPAAVALAKRTPSLEVGLHLAMVAAPPAADPADIPDLLAADGSGLGQRPIVTGARAAMSRRVRAQVRRELVAQFEAFRRAGLRPQPCGRPLAWPPTSRHRAPDCRARARIRRPHRALAARARPGLCPGCAGRGLRRTRHRRRPARAHPAGDARAPAPRRHRHQRLVLWQDRRRQADPPIAWAGSSRACRRE